MSVVKGAAGGILGGFRWQTFLLGAGAGLVGEAVATPILVELVKGGLALTTAAAGVVAQARAEMARAEQQAQAQSSQPNQTDVAALAAELKALREEIATLKVANAVETSGERVSG